VHSRDLHELILFVVTLRRFNVKVLEIDVVSEQSISDAIAILSKKTNGRLDLLVNNVSPFLVTLDTLN